MSRGVSSGLANIALAAGIAFAMAVAVVFTLPHPSAPTPAPAESATKGVVYLKLPPARRLAPVPAAPRQRAPIPVKETKPLATPVAAPAPEPLPPLDLRAGSDEPFEPPAPPIVAAASSPSTPRFPKDTQIAALPPAEPVPLTPAPVPITRVVAPSAPPVVVQAKPIAPTEPPIQVHAGDPVPPLRTVPLASHEVHAVPAGPMPVRPVTIVGREKPAPLANRAPPRPRPAAPMREARAHPVEREAPTQMPETEERSAGPSVSGVAIVTDALELNVAGKPLKLAGVTLPVTTDMCAPDARHAARACADVTRQALTNFVGPDAEIACRILAGGRGAWPAVCKNKNGADLAAYLIAHGFALAADGEMTDYSAMETRARAAHSGLWSYR